MITINEIISSVGPLFDYFFLEYDEIGVKLICTGRWSGLRYVTHYSYAQKDLYQLIKNENCIPKRESSKY